MGTEDYAAMTAEQLLAKKLERFQNLNHYRRDNELHWLGRARVSEECGDYAAAVRFCSKGISRVPRNGQMYAERARLSLLLGEYGEAAADCARACEFYPQDYMPRYLSGLVHYLRGEYPRAEQHFRCALDAVPGASARVQTGYWLWACMLKQNKPSEAAAAARTCLPAVPEELTHSGVVYAAALEAAQKCFLPDGPLKREESVVLSAYGAYLFCRYVSEDTVQAVARLEDMLSLGLDGAPYTPVFRAVLTEK